MNGAVSEATGPEGLARAECGFDTDGADGGLTGLFQPRGIAYMGRYGVVASSGFAESSADGYALQTRIASVAADAGMRIIGPNCNGLWNVVDGLSLGFNTAHGLALRPGKVGVVAQTGAVLGSSSPVLTGWAVA